MRIAQLATSLGSRDAMFWTEWMTLIDRVGIFESYHYNTMMNHPPLALLIAQAAGRLGAQFGLLFVDSFRLLQSAADILTAIALVGIARRLMPVEAPAASATYSPAMLFFLSPAVIFISAFHCNSDPLMMMFLVLAVLAALEHRPAWSGGLLALAVGIKIVPLLVGPLFLIALRERTARIRFLSAAAVVSAAIFGPGFVLTGPVFYERIFGYTGTVRAWGFPLLAIFGEHAGWKGLTTLASLLPVAIVLALAALWFVESRRPEDATRLPRLTGLSWLIVLFLAPGFGVQYLYWTLPFAFFALPRIATLVLHGVTSVFLFAAYTVWSGGWPWWYADRAAGGTGRILVITGLALWAAIGVMTAIAIRRARTRNVADTQT